jgi:hypothetical protein
MDEGWRRLLGQYTQNESAIEQKLLSKVLVKSSVFQTTCPVRASNHPESAVRRFSPTPQALAIAGDTDVGGELSAP